jgi:hypothetical protein
VRPYLSQLPLTHGWLPAAVQLIAAAALVGAIGWRTRRWRLRWLPLVLAGGAGLAAAAHWYIESVGVAGDPAPAGLWVWI